MALDPHIQKAADLKPDYDALLAQIAAMRADMTRMAAQMTDSVTTHGAAMAQTVSEGITDARQYALRKGHAADVRIEHAIAANPYVAIGLAAGIGLLLGAMARK